MSWRDWAACLGQSDLMFDSERTSQALELCSNCRVIAECRETVISDVKLRRAYAFVGATVGGFPPAELKRRRKRRVA